MSREIPITYVPARNTVFLALALAWAETLSAFDIWIGVNCVDYSGYPDCRPEYLRSFETLANLATRAGVEGRGTLPHSCPALAPEQGTDHRTRSGARRRLRARRIVATIRRPMAWPAGGATPAASAALHSNGSSFATRSPTSRKAKDQAPCTLLCHLGPFLGLRSWQFPEEPAGSDLFLSWARFA